MIVRSMLRPLYAPDDAIAAAAPNPDAGSPSAAASAQVAPDPGAAAAASSSAQPALSPAAAVPEAAPVVEAVAAAAAPATAEVAKPAIPEFPPSALDAGQPAAEPAKAQPTDPKPAEAKDGTAKPDAKPEAKPDDKSADATKPAPDVTEAPAAEAQAPITYAFNFPEDIKPDSVNKERLDAFTKSLGDGRVAPEVAQQMLDLHIAEVRDLAKQVEERVSTRQWDVFRTEQDRQLSEIKADPVLGGSRFQTAMRTCAAAIEQYGGTADDQKALYDVLRSTGAGNNIHVARFFHRIGEMFGREGRMIPAAQPSRPAPTRQQRGESRYAGTTPR